MFGILLYLRQLRPLRPALSEGPLTGGTSGSISFFFNQMQRNRVLPRPSFTQVRPSRLTKGSVDTWPRGK